MDYLLTNWHLWAQYFTKCFDYFFMFSLCILFCFQIHNEFNVNVNDPIEDGTLSKSEFWDNLPWKLEPFAQTPGKFHLHLESSKIFFQDDWWSYGCVWVTTSSIMQCDICQTSSHVWHVMDHSQNLFDTTQPIKGFQQSEIMRLWIRHFGNNPKHSIPKWNMEKWVEKRKYSKLSKGDSVIVIRLQPFYLFTI